MTTETSNTGQTGPTVLQVIPELNVGGAERTTVDIARALVDDGGVALVASRGGELSCELEDVGGRLLSMSVHSKNPLVVLLNAFRLRGIIRRERVNIVHARSRAPAWSALLAARMAGVSFVTTYHGSYQAKSGVKRWYNSVMAQGDLVIANSNFIADHIAMEHGLPKSKIRVVHRGSDLARFDARSIESNRLVRLRADWEMSDDGVPIILLPGRLTRWKGQEVFVEAIGKLVKSGCDQFHAVMIGDAQGRDTYAAGLQNSIRMRGLSSRLKLAGHCDDWPAAYGLADVVVSASIEPEAFGRVAVEAQAMEKPIVATDHGGSLETIVIDDGGRTGWRVIPGDPQAMARALKGVLELSLDQRAEIGRRGRANAETNFSVAAMCGKTLDIYRELLRT